MVFSFALKALWVAVGLAGALVAFAVLSTIDFAMTDSEQARSATFGFLVMAALIGIPAGIALVRARAKVRAEKLQELVLGFVRSRDSISPAELARKTELSELEAEAMLITLIESNKVDLVFHRSRDEYLHRQRIGTSHQCLDKCESCGAALRAQVIFVDETIHCEYCNTPLNMSSNQ